MTPAEMPTSRIGSGEKRHAVLALGCWAFGGQDWGEQADEDSMAAMRTAYDAGLTHFDTAAGYGRGKSERLVGRFADDKRERIFLASKAYPGKINADYMFHQVGQSLERLGVDCIDLYYIHWPIPGKDMRPAMEGLERAREKGKIRAIGVSNFSVEQMEQVSRAGRIDAHQFCYNLLWRAPESDVLPYCREKGIAAVTYSSIAQGVLSGKFGQDPKFSPGDDRPRTVIFRPEIWPEVHQAVERLKSVAQDAERPLAHLAIRWLADRPGVTSVIVGARNAAQAADNAAAMSGPIPESIFHRMTELTEGAAKRLAPFEHLWQQ